MADVELPIDSAALQAVPREAAPARRNRPVTIAAIVVLVGALGVLGYRWWSDPVRKLDGDVVAQADACHRLFVVTEGYVFLGDGIPDGWVNGPLSGALDPDPPDEIAGAIVGPPHEVPGRLDVTKVLSTSNVHATFIADDGTRVGLVGGKAGSRFFPLGCALAGG